jgi:hypothetical protein
MGLSDSRMTASTMPSTTPKIIDSTVTSSVPLISPSITGVWFIASKTNGQLNAGLKNSMLRNISASTAITAIDTHRHGCRTGLASMTPGRSAASDRVSAPATWLAIADLRG